MGRDMCSAQLGGYEQCPPAVLSDQVKQQKLLDMCRMHVEYNDVTRKCAGHHVQCTCS